MPEQSTIIVFNCKSCGHKIKVPEKYGSKKGKCPKCHEPVIIPILEKESVKTEEMVSVECQMCGQVIEVAKNGGETYTECPSCGSYVETSLGGAMVESDAFIQPPTGEQQYQEESEEYEGSEGMDRRLLFIISGAAAVVVFGLIIVVAVLRLSGSKFGEGPESFRKRQQIVNPESQLQTVTSNIQARESTMQQLNQKDVSPKEPKAMEESLLTQDKIVFWSDRDGKSNIYIMNLDGSEQRSISKRPVYGYNVLSCSPDAKKIVYVGSGGQDIYIIDVKSGEQNNLTNTRFPYTNLSWSSDGKKIVFIKHQGIPEIYVMNADGSGQKNLTNDPGYDYYPSWSPDGMKIAFFTERVISGVLHQDIYVMNADGSEQVNLTNSSPYPGSPGYMGLVRDLSWSPDGTKLAFTSRSEIYIMNANGSGQKKLTNSPAHESDLSWSPDGKKIAFVSERSASHGASGDVCVINADGSGLIKLTNNPAHDCDPSWTPDGKKIVFCSKRDSNGEIFIINADGSEQKKLTNNPSGNRGDRFPSLLSSIAPQSQPLDKPESQQDRQDVADTNLRSQLTASNTPGTELTSLKGKLGNTKIAYSSKRRGNYEIYIMNPDGSGQRNLTNDLAFLGYGERLDRNPFWSSDGRTIAFLSMKGNCDIFVMNADGSNKKNLTNTPGYDHYFSWSPDGTKIAFTSDRDKNDEIYVMNADGTDQINLTNSRAGDYCPSWSPDGKMIVFYSMRGNGQIYVINADGSDQRKLIAFSDNRYPSWSPDGRKIVFSSDKGGGKDGVAVINADGSGCKRLAETSISASKPLWSPDGTKIAFVSRIDGNLEIYIMNADGTDPKNLTNNPADDMDLSWSPDGKKIAFVSLRDANRRAGIKGNREIYVMNADGSDQTRLTNNPDWDFNPSWSPFLDK